MSTTLTNGLKLPDKGSVDWYADMQSNYAILDGAVGTIAEHTSQITGKAPLVHTHTKSDVTDLFNSANTWTALNSYNQSIQITANFNIGATPSSEIFGGFNFGNGTTNIGSVTSRISSSGATYSRLHIGNRFANDALDPNGSLKFVELQVGLRANGDRFIYTDGLWRNSLTPYDSGVSIGDSTHQWNNLYAKNYYYNGVAWGLDKANVWTSWQTFENANGNALLRLRRTDIKIGDAIPSAQKEVGTIAFAGSDNINLGLITTRDENSGHTRLVFAARQRYDSNGNRANNGTGYEARMDLGIDESRNYYLRPNTDSNISLGISTNKWKSFNGINPGALSLPDISKYTDLTSNIPSASLDGTTEINLSSYITSNGWLSIVVPDTNTDDFVFCQNGSTLNNRYFMSGARGNGFISLMMPINNTGEVKVLIKASSVTFCRFYQCLGNV